MNVALFPRPPGIQIPLGERNHHPSIGADTLAVEGWRGESPLAGVVLPFAGQDASAGEPSGSLQSRSFAVVPGVIDQDVPEVIGVVEEVNRLPQGGKADDITVASRRLQRGERIGHELRQHAEQETAVRSGRAGNLPLTGWGGRYRYLCHYPVSSRTGTASRAIRQGVGLPGGPEYDDGAEHLRAEVGEAGPLQTGFQLCQGE